MAKAQPDVQRTKNQCIRHPKDSLIIIHDWQIEACDRDVCAAAILADLEYWHNIKLDMIDRGNEEVNLWQYRTEEDLEKEIKICKRQKIRQSLKIIVAKGFVEVGGNPNPKFHWDRKRFFLFRPENVQAWLDKQKELDHIHQVKSPVELDHIHQVKTPDVHQGKSPDEHEGNLPDARGIHTGTLAETTSSEINKTEISKAREGEADRSLSSSVVDEGKDKKKSDHLDLVLDKLCHSLFEVGDHATPPINTGFYRKNREAVKDLLRRGYTPAEILGAFQQEFDKCDDWERKHIVYKFAQEGLALDALAPKRISPIDPAAQEFIAWVETRFNGQLSTETRDLPGIASALRRHGMAYCQEALLDEFAICETKKHLREAIQNFLKTVDVKAVGYKDRDAKQTTIINEDAMLYPDPADPRRNLADLPPGVSHEAFTAMLIKPWEPDE